MLVTQTCLSLCNSWTIALQAPLYMELSRQEYWSGLPCPLLGDLPNPEIKPRSPTLQVDILKNCQIVFQSNCIILHFYQQNICFVFSTSSRTFVIVYLSYSHLGV